MKTIWKFPFMVQDRIILEMPISARILTVQVQNGTPCVWALVEDSYQKTKRVFRCYGTGHELDEDRPGLVNGVYVGTFQMLDGALVFHLFDFGEVP